ncbi:MAG: hypothetical protein JWP58_2119 [Hymenobacter sp.]|nr:hypothetical protein [Hymenobacter sp.]
MAKKDYYPEGTPALLQWLQLQVQQWNLHYADFGFTMEQMKLIVDRIQALINKIQAVAKLQADAAEAVRSRDELAASFETWYRAEIQRDRRVENLPAAFKWDGTAQAPPNPDTTQPTVGSFHAAPGQIDLDWARGPFDGVDVDLSYDGQAWAPGGFDNRSPYEDRRPLRTPGTPETRYYRLRFRYKGEPFGQYSAVGQVVAAG